MKKVIFPLMIVILAVIMSSCLKETLPDPVDKQSVKDVTASDSFNYETFKTVDLNLSATSGGIVEVLSKDRQLYQKAFIIENQLCEMKINIPSYVNSIRLKFQGNEILIENIGNTVTWSFAK